MKTPITLIILHFYFISLQAQTDTIPPVLECHDITNLNFSPECFHTIHFSELIDTVYDNVSGTEHLAFGLRKSCTGVGFPEGVHTVIVDVTQIARVDVWVRDEAGNTTTKTVRIVLNNGVCESGHVLSAEMPVPTAPQIRDVGFDFKVIDGCTGDTMTFQKNSGTSGGIVNWGWIVPYDGSTIETEAFKNTNPLNGVTTADVALISQHILGITPFDSPYKIIAADANQDGKVTMMDIIFLRKLILGLIDELPNGKSWRFIPKNYVFQHPANPFYPGVPYQIITPNTMPASNIFEFIGVKIGDVNLSADPSQ